MDVSSIGVSEITFYIKSKGVDKLVIIYLYVDNLIYISNSKVLIKEFKIAMKSE